MREKSLCRGHCGRRGETALTQAYLNAIKYTPAGGRVSLQLGQNDSAHLITVADTGSGIPVDAQPHIFERFYRADKARSHSASVNGNGEGLGSSIARWIAEAHDGSLTLLQSDYAGSVFAASLSVKR